MCNIVSFCGVSIFDLASRHLVVSAELARARAAVLEYLCNPSLETDDDAVEFNIVDNFVLGANGNERQGSFESREQDSGGSGSKDVQTSFSAASFQLHLVDDLRKEAGITQHLPADYTSVMDMYGR